MSKVSVAIPVYNEERSIASTIESLLRQTRKPDEIVVSDGGSTDRTREILAGFARDGAPVRCVSNPARRVGAGRNRAIDAAAHPTVACIDAGNTADETWLEILTETLSRHGGSAIAVGRIIPQAESRFEDCVSRVLYDYMHVLPTGEKDRARRARQGRDPLSSSCIAFPKEVWERVGGYPEWLDAGEDKLFAKKLVAQGIPIVRRQDAVVRHHMRGNPLSLFRQALRYGRGSGGSGQSSRQTGHLVVRYALALALAAGAVAAGPPALKIALAVPLVAGGVLHLQRQGYRPLLRSGGRLDVQSALLVPVVLLSRDLGALAGHGFGNLERWLRPDLRSWVRKYMS